MTQRSKSTLFLIEQLIVIAVFAISAVACVSILTTAFFYTNNSSATRHALIHAESSAEVYKATGGDFSAVASAMGGVIRQSESNTDIVVVYYDSNWHSSSEANAGFVMTLEADTSRNPYDFEFTTANLVIERITGEELLTLELAVLDSTLGNGERG